MAALRLVELQPLLLAPINLSIGAGELYFVSGPSGAGKSLLLRAIADLDCNTGEAFVDETPRSSMSAPAWRRRVGLLPAESGWWHDTVAPHFPTPEAADASTSTLLGRLGFGPEVFDWEILRLSTGERQRLALARLLANRPEVLLLDEATANLDPVNRDHVEALITEYSRANGTAMLWASHDPDQRRRLSEALGGGRLTIDNGQLVPEA